MNNNKYKILLIEDEKNISNIVTALLEANGYQVITASTCQGGFLMFDSYQPDLVILDLGLPDIDGMEFLKRVRRNNLTPIIVLSARSDEGDKVDALDNGANDYITKPFGSNELMARVRTAIRSSSVFYGGDNFENGKYVLGDLVIDYEARRIFSGEEEIRFTQTEYNIIALLSRHTGKVLTYSHIIKAIWGYNDIGSTKKLQVNMANIRKKFGAKPGQKNYIVNELGVGYRMGE